MAQILRRDCPLLKRGLTPSQRLNYSNAMLHFFFGVPRLILILSPLSYLLLGIHPVQADAWALLAYIFPHIGLSTLANSLLSDRFRHSFWAGVYEVSIAPFTAGVTFLALINPRLGRFNVTDKGTSLAEARWDFSNAWGTLALLALSFGALGVAFPIRLSLFARGFTDTSELNATLINSVWAFANIWTLIAAACVAFEQPQQREAPRVKRSFPSRLRAGGVSLRGYTVDMSEKGVRLALEDVGDVPESCEVVVTSDFGLTLALPAQRCWCEWGKDGPEVGLRFVNVDEEAHRRLVRMIFSGDRSWVDETHPRDDPYRSFLYLLSTLWRIGEPRRARSRRALRVRGPWPCTLQGVEATCLTASTEGAEVELPTSIEAREGSFPFSLGDFAVSARIVARRGTRRFGLAFDWPDPASRAAFFRGLLRGRERA
jgi:cellulose synthase (UDP-forming)